MYFSDKVSAQTSLNFFEDFEGTNNWVLENGNQTNKWHIGSAVSSGVGNKSLYISNDNGVKNEFTPNSASIVHAFRDISIPAGTTNATLSFDWRGRGQALLGVGILYFDYLRVWLVPVDYKPTAGSNVSESSSRVLIGYFISQTDFTTFTRTENLSSFAGTTMKLLFEWINNDNFGNQPPAAIDNVSLFASHCTVNPVIATSTDRIVNMSITNSLGGNYSHSTPTGNSGYLYTNNQPALDLVRGSTNNTLSITFGTSDLANMQFSAAWIDFNGNGIYEASEVVALATSAATSNATVTYTFTVPTTASLGQKRIRLRGGSNATYSAGGACVQSTYGDTEDYNINIVDPSVVTNYIWNGNVNSNWQVASNWTPNGIPTTFDNVTINSGANVLNITDTRTVGNMAWNGNLIMAANSNLIIRGDVSYNSSATANLNCASKIEIRSNSSQTIPPVNYGNLDATGGNRILPSSGTVGICNTFNPGVGTYIVTGSTVNYFSPSTGSNFTMSPFTYHNLRFSGTATFTVGQGNTINVLGDYTQSSGIVNLTNFTSGSNTLNVEGNMSILGGTFNLNANGTAGAASTINLKGDLIVNSAGKLDATQGNNTGKVFNFSGTGNGTSASQIQSLNVAFPDASRNRRIQFYAKPGSYVQLVRDFDLGDNSRFYVEGGAVLDFGFTGTTANNITGNARVATGFTASSGAYLKISSPEGILNTAGAVGNVRTANNPSYAAGTFHYIGKVNQSMGSGIGAGANGSAVIVELDNNNLVLSPSTAFRLVNLPNANINNGLGGVLDIRRGRVEETDVNFISTAAMMSASGVLKMSAGTGYKVTKASSNSIDSEYIPRFFNMDLAGGEIELASTGIQTLRPSNAYQNLAFTNTGIKTLAGNTTVADLTKVTGGSLIIPATADNAAPRVLTAKKGLQNTGGTITFEDNAQLLQDTDAVNIGNIQSQRIASNINNLTTQMDYLYWGSPVAGQPLQAFSPGTPANRLYQYNESNDLFNAVNQTLEPNFVPAKGYAFRAESTLANGSSKTYTFTGTPNNGPIDIAIKRSPNTGVNDEVIHGYNLVGNPYPSNIKFDELYLGNSNLIWNTAYFWTNNNFLPTQMGSNYVPNNYAIYNGTGGNSATKAADGSGITAVPNGIVKVGQGFIIQKKDFGEGTLRFRNSYSVSNILRVADNGTFFQKIEASKNRFWLTLTSPKDIVNSILVGYVQGSTDDYETDFDSELLVIASDSFYSILGTKKLAIQGRSADFTSDDVVSLGGVFSTSGNYTIRLQTPEGIFANNQNIFLRDKLLGKYINLSQITSYTFTSAKGVDATRFEIVYRESSILGNSEGSKSDFQVYRDGESFIVRSSKILGAISIYDTAGRLLRDYNSGTREFRLDIASLPNGVFIIKAENSGDVRTKKIFK